MNCLSLPENRDCKTKNLSRINAGKRLKLHGRANILDRMTVTGRWNKIVRVSIVVKRTLRLMKIG